MSLEKAPQGRRFRAADDAADPAAPFVTGGVALREGTQRGRRSPLSTKSRTPCRTAGAARRNSSASTGRGRRRGLARGPITKAPHAQRDAVMNESTLGVDADNAHEAARLSESCAFPPFPSFSASRDREIRGCKQNYESRFRPSLVTRASVRASGGLRIHRAGRPIPGHGSRRRHSDRRFVGAAAATGMSERVAATATIFRWLDDQ